MEVGQAREPRLDRHPLGRCQPRVAHLRFEAARVDVASRIGGVAGLQRGFAVVAVVVLAAALVARRDRRAEEDFIVAFWHGCLISSREVTVRRGRRCRPQANPQLSCVVEGSVVVVEVAGMFGSDSGGASARSWTTGPGSAPRSAARPAATRSGAGAARPTLSAGGRPASSIGAARVLASTAGAAVATGAAAAAMPSTSSAPATVDWIALPPLPEPTTVTVGAGAASDDAVAAAHAPSGSRVDEVRCCGRGWGCRPTPHGRRARPRRRRARCPAGCRCSVLTAVPSVVAAARPFCPRRG